MFNWDVQKQIKAFLVFLRRQKISLYFRKSNSRMHKILTRTPPIILLVIKCFEFFVIPNTSFSWNPIVDQPILQNIFDVANSRMPLITRYQNVAQDLLPKKFFPASD